MTGQYGLADLTDDRYAYLDGDVQMGQTRITKPKPVKKPTDRLIPDQRTPSGKPMKN